MGASKRSNYTASRNAGTEAARNLGVVLGLGGLSFFLGFFVLSRMVPDKHDASGLTPVAAPITPNTSGTALASRTTPEPVRGETSTPVEVQTPKRDDKGPIVERETEPATQSPGRLDRTSPPATSDTTGSVSSAGNVPVNDANPAETADSALKTGSETGSASAALPRSGRHSRTATMPDASSASDKTDNGGFSQEDQKPSRIDREGSTDTSTRSERRDDAGATASRSERTDSTSDETPRTAKTTVKRVRYSVRGSAYSRREAAEREVRRITDLGLDATVVPITTEDGTTVYRVQQGVYRNRSNAEKARTKLSDAGVEAEIVKSP